MLFEYLEILKKSIGEFHKTEYHIRDHSLETEYKKDGTYYLMKLSIHEYEPLKNFFTNEERYQEFMEVLKLPDWNKYLPNYSEVKDFVLVNYSYNHLTQRQMSRLSGIPQQTLFAMIKHMKLKHVYPDMTKKERVVEVQEDGTTKMLDPKPKLPISKKSAQKKKWKKKK